MAFECPENRLRVYGLQGPATVRAATNQKKLSGIYESLLNLNGRENSLISALDTVLARARWNSEELKDFQFQSLKKIVTYAYAHVPLYKNKYGAAGFKPQHLRHWKDLQRIPVLTKQELRQADLQSLRSSPTERHDRLLASSGSTGIPGRLYRDDESLWHFAAYNMLLYHHWCRAGLKERPVESVLYFIDLTSDSIDFVLADLLLTTVMRERIISVAESPSTMIEAIEEFSPEFISSYPSTMRNIAIEMIRRNITDPRLKLLHLTSETLDRKTRGLLKSAFPGVRIIETYTSSEAGLLGFQCLQEDRWHLTENGAIYEIADSAGKPASADEVGELVVTDLTNWATPIIRYQGLGDFCRWDTTQCSCGSPLRSIKHLEGRSSESFLRADGSMISPYVLTNLIEEIPGIVQYQVIQHNVTQFEVLLLQDGTKDVPENKIRKALDEVFALVLPHADLNAHFVEQISPKAGRHKVPLVISHIRRPM